jgi:AraC-like DNA-binding protein
MTRKTPSDLPAPTTPRGAIVFDTNDVAPGERIDAWTDHLAKNFATFDFNVARGDRFFGRMETLALGPLRINRGDCSAAHWARLERHLNDGRDDYGMCIALSGGYRLMHNGVDAVQGAGSFTLIDNARPSDTYVGASGVNYDIVVPRKALRNTQRVRTLSSPPILDLESSATRLLAAYIESIYQSQEDFSDSALSATIGEHLLDLIVLGLQPTPDAAERAKNRGLKAARLRSVLAEIQRRFADPDLTANTVAASVHLPEGYIHALLEEQGLNFVQAVVDLRLNLAVALLGDRRNSHVGIGEIARQCGFADLPKFHRGFYARFGQTPSDMRMAIIAAQQ